MGHGGAAGGEGKVEGQKEELRGLKDEPGAEERGGR